jgi:hypothetical protein
VTVPAGPRAGFRARAAAILGAGLIAAAGLAYVAEREQAPPPAAAAKPRLMLLTTLPLVFGERFGLEGGGSPALKALETRYTVNPVGVADAATLKQGKLLLMAHPLAQPAEALVDLDRWVRSGGRLLLLADPLLEWPSERPLGDTLRPPPAFADTGLLRHWGLRLDAPDERGPRLRMLGGHEILTASPGTLVATGRPAGAELTGRAILAAPPGRGRRGCLIYDGGLTARCGMGKGEVTIVADADFLNVEDLDGPTDKNLAALLAEISALGR